MNILRLIADLLASHPVTSCVAPNTVRSDAHRFVRHLISQAPGATRHFNGVLIEYSSKWPGMHSEAWRSEVLRLIAEKHPNMLTSPKFAGPCQLDSDWQFSCYSAVRAIRDLALDDPMP